MTTMRDKDGRVIEVAVMVGGQRVKGTLVTTSRPNQGYSHSGESCREVFSTDMLAIGFVPDDNQEVDREKVDQFWMEER